MNSYWVLWVAHAWAQKITVRQQNHCKFVTYLTVILSYQDLGRRRTETMHHSEWAALSHTAIDSAVGEWHQRLRACVRAGGEHIDHLLK